MKAGKESMEKNITKLYLMNFFSNAQFHLVVFTLFLLSKGFTMQQFFLIEAAFAITVLLTEVPTGIFSDKKGRKNSLILGSIIGIPVIPIVIFSDSFIIVLIAMSVAGISFSFVSGTDIAILYDTLKALKRENEFKKILGKLNWYVSLSMALAAIIGGFLAQMNLSYGWWAFFIAGLFAFFIRITLKEPPLFKESREKISYLLHLRKSFEQAFKGKARYFVLYASIIWIFFFTGFWLWQPYLKLIGVPLFIFGFIYMGGYLISGFVSKQAYKIENKIGMRNSLLFIPFLLGLSFILESQFIFIFAFLFIFLQEISRGYFSPLLEDYINSRISSSKRATVLSIKNMLSSILFVIFSLSIGYFVDIFSLITALLVMGIIVIILSIIFFFSFRK